METLPNDKIAPAMPSVTSWQWVVILLFSLATIGVSLYAFMTKIEMPGAMPIRNPDVNTAAVIESELKNIELDNLDAELRDIDLEMQSR